MPSPDPREAARRPPDRGRSLATPGRSGPPAAGDVERQHACALEHCPACGSDLVVPVAWNDVGADHWAVAVRCPNCWWEGGGTYPQAVVERFDEALDRGTEALIADYRRLMYANMEEELSRFQAALAADQIWPMDF